MAGTRTPSLSPNSMNSDEDSLELPEVSEKSLWILTKGQRSEEDVDEGEVERLTSENKDLKNENEELKKKLSAAESGEKDAKEKLEQKEKEMTSLERQLQDKQKELDASKANSESQLLVIRQEQTKKDAEMKSLRDENGAFKKEINSLKGQLCTKEDEMDKLAKEVEKLKGQQQEMQQSRTDDDKTKKAEITLLTAEIGELKRQLRDGNSHVKELNQQASAHGAEKDQFAKEVERLQGELLAMQQTTNDDSKAKQAEIDRLTEENGKLRRQLVVKSGQVEDLEQLDNTHEKEKERLMKEADQLRDQLLKMQRASSSLTDTAQAKENERKTREIEQLKQDLACAQENIAELMGASGGGGGGGAGVNRGSDRKETATAASDASHTCPVCDKTLRVSQAEFERHVNAHFN